MLADLEKTTKAGMDKAINSLTVELKKVRTGRAQVSMLDGLKVEYYGALTPLSQVASISCPDAKSFVIAPWEASVLKDIESAIVKSELGMSPQNDGKIIRLRLPDLTEERRKELVKHIKKIVEDARVAVRMSRRDANERLKQAQKDKAISEDEQKKGGDKIQKLTDEFIAKIDKLGSDKEKEIMTI